MRTYIGRGIGGKGKREENRGSEDMNSERRRKKRKEEENRGSKDVYRGRKIGKGNKEEN